MLSSISGDSRNVKKKKKNSHNIGISLGDAKKGGGEERLIFENRQ